MSPKCLPPKARRQVIRDNILGDTFEVLATKCYCTKRTIIRDVNQWRQEGGFEQFLMDEFFRSYPNIKQEFPDKAFDRLCYLLGKTLTRKIEKTVDVEQKIGIIVKMWKPEDDATG